MIPYWLIFLIPAFAVMTTKRDIQHVNIMSFLFFTVFVTLMIGTRFEVGGDWFSYLEHYYMVHYLSLEDSLVTSDAGYAALNWLMDGIDWGIYGVNLVCGVIFMTGLAAFALRTPDPWLAMLVAIPYLLVVVAMGYTRQAVALGFEFLALNALARKENWRFYGLIICGALFHKTAIVLLLLGVFSGPNRFSIIRICLGLVVAYFAINAFMADEYERLVKNYVEAQMQSSGAVIRVFMNALPALLLLVCYRKWRQQINIESPWLVFALTSIACVPMLAVTSTAVDRMALYLIPLQLYVWVHFPIVMESPGLRVAVVVYHAVVLFVWLNFASHAFAWLPYQSVIFQ